MNAGATSERVYGALKRRILDHGFRPGERLDPARLKEQLHSSVTPVRDALHVMTGERLVEARTSDGFHVIALDAPALQDLYEWNAQILLLAIRAWPSGAPAVKPPADCAPSEPASAVAELFATIARHSPNAEHLRAVASASDRLNAVRLSEAVVLPDLEAELAQISSALGKGDTALLRRSLRTYHRRRHRAASAIVRALYRPI